MARPLRIEYPGAFYLVTARGNERKNIFSEFIDKIKGKYLRGRKRDRDIPAVAALTKVTPERILKAIQQELKDNPEHIRKAAICLSHRFSGLSLKEIGRQIGIGESAVSQASRRYEAITATDIKLRKMMENVKQFLSIV